MTNKSITISFLWLLFVACSPVGLQNEGYNATNIESRDKALEFYRKGRLNAQFGSYDSALFFYDKAIELDETYYEPHQNKAQIYLGRKEYAKALSESEMALQKSSGLAEEWAFAGMLHERLGDSSTALNYYQRSVELYDTRISDPDKADKVVPNSVMRAITLILLGEEAKGREELRKLSKENPAYPIPEELITIDKQGYIKMILDKD